MNPRERSHIDELDILELEKGGHRFEVLPAGCDARVRRDLILPARCR